MAAEPLTTHRHRRPGPGAATATATAAAAATSRRRGVRHRRSALASLLLLTAVVAPLASPATPASAQATPVTVRVSTVPLRPRAGADVEVKVRVSQCEDPDQGEGVRVEVFLLGDDTSTSSATMVGRDQAVTSLWFRSTATIRLQRATKGWYGVRVLCGEFRPPRGALPGTTFAVGTESRRTARVADGTVTAGATATMQGDGCPGSAVEYEVAANGAPGASFQPTGRIATRPDGTWSGDVAFPAEMPAGPATVRVRCVVEGIDGTSVELGYDEVPTVTVLAATPPAGG